MKRFLYLTLLLFAACAVQGQTTDKVQADSLYAQQKYKEAAKLYEKILEGGESATVYYNLGNAYYRLGDMGRAILNYERAARREPGNSDIRFNLALARSKTTDKIQAIDSFFLSDWFRSFLNCFNADQWGRLSIVALAFMLAGLLCFVFVQRLRLRKIGFGIAIAGVLLTLLFNLFAFLQRQQYLDHTYAIVMQAASVKSTPADSGTSLFDLHEGTKVKILDNSMRDWLQIRLSDGKTGWMAKHTVEMI